MSVQPLTAWVDGIGVIGPGLADWPSARAVLAGTQPLSDQKTQLPPPASLPPAERRRAGMAVKAALAVGAQALQASGCATADLASVFSSSGGDAVNCHEICAALASSDRAISPTRFHNSVHNAPSGYWSIGSGAMATSSVLCAYDGSFAAGLLEALTQCVVEARPVLLVAYDTDYPEPLRGVRPIPDTFGVALLLAPAHGGHSLARLALSPRGAFDGTPQRMADAGLERLRAGIPAARSLPLLQWIARGSGGADGAAAVVLDYLDGMPLSVQVQPC